MTDILLNMKEDVKKTFVKHILKNPSKSVERALYFLNKSDNSHRAEEFMYSVLNYEISEKDSSQIQEKKMREFVMDFLLKNRTEFINKIVEKTGEDMTEESFYEVFNSEIKKV